MLGIEIQQNKVNKSDLTRMCQTKHNIPSQVAGGAGVEHASTNEDNAVRFMKNSIAIIASAFPLRPLFYWYWCTLG